MREEVGKYRVIRMLDKGPRGDVYLVQHMRLRVNYAMRVISPGLMSELPMIALNHVRVDVHYAIIAT